MGHLGLPYAWGGGGSRGPGPGQDPDLGIIGFDCSGLTQYAYAPGRDLDPAQQPGAVRRAAQGRQRRPAGPVTSSSGRPTRPTRATIHHVAIYLGGGKMVEAPESGDVVKVSNMRWKGYAGAVRPSA